MKVGVRGSLGVFCLVAAGCRIDESTMPHQPTPEQTSVMASDETTDLSALGRFDVEVRALGPIRLRDPIVLEYKVTARIATPRARIALFSPEAHYAARSGWTARGRAPNRSAVTPADELVAAMNVGQSIVRRVEMTIPQPGYYRLYATADAADESMVLPTGDFVQNFSHQELGLLVDENGGRLTAQFDLKELPDSIRRIAGVRQFRSAPFVRERESTEASAALAARALRGSDGPSLTVDPYSIGGRIRYVNPVTGENLPVGGLRYQVDVQEAMSGQIVYSYSGWTSPDGEWQIGCPGSNEYIYVNFFYDGAFIISGSPAGSGYADGWCGIDEGDWLVGPDQAHSWLNAGRVKAASMALFGGWDRPPVELRYTTTQNSYYDRNNEITQARDWIVLRTNAAVSHIYGEFGAFAIAHEFGHAMHDDAFGGYPLSVNCPQQGHAYDIQLNVVCAFVEGFADFHAVATLGAETGQLNDIENNIWYPFAGGNGRTNEGTVAAFFYDLIDPANEPHDNVQFPGQYIGKILQTCKVRYGSTWFHNSETSHNIFCFERAVDAANATLLAPLPVSYQESASEPTSWNLSAIRAVWRRNLFNQ